jgi:hypothetical protein
VLWARSLPRNPYNILLKLSRDVIIEFPRTWWKASLSLNPLDPVCQPKHRKYPIAKRNNLSFYLCRWWVWGILRYRKLSSYSGALAGSSHLKTLERFSTVQRAVSSIWSTYVHVEGKLFGNSPEVSLSLSIIFSDSYVYRKNRGTTENYLRIKTGTKQKKRKGENLLQKKVWRQHDVKWLWISWPPETRVFGDQKGWKKRR